MGLYSHYTDAELQTLRTSLLGALHARLTAATAASANGRSVQYQTGPDAIRKELQAVTQEIARRSGTPAHRPIYMAV